MNNNKKFGFNFTAPPVANPSAAFQWNDFNRNRQPIKVLGYKEKKLGGWDKETTEKIEEIKGKTTVVESDSSSYDEQENTESKIETNEGESNWEQFSKYLNERKTKVEPKKEEYKPDDPFFIIMNKKKEKKQLNYIPGQPNRFGINPGPWWDGINRSNGFERKRFEIKQQNEEEKDKEYQKMISRL